MGFRFRKSKKIGPVRFTLSKSGLSTSIGVKGFRVTKGANGRVRTTVSIPGTGISYAKDLGSKSISTASSVPKAENPPVPPPPSKKTSSLFAALAVFGILFLLFIFGFLIEKHSSPDPVFVHEKAISVVVETSVSPSPALEPFPTAAPVLTVVPTPASVIASTTDPPSKLMPSLVPAQTVEPDVRVSVYVANTNTKKFHKPSCSSVDDMLEHNKVIYETDRDDMLRMGYEPCEKCKP